MKAKDFYRLCLNTDQANAQSIQGLLDILGDTGNTTIILYTLVQTCITRGGGLQEVMHECLYSHEAL